MKRGIVIFLGACLGLVAGALSAYLFNTWYASQYVHSDDDSNFLVTLLIFGFLPGFAFVGGAVAKRLYARNNT